ncbi:cytochrome P450 [Marivita sp. GX14005]|uniref:cytochrome P450 n=1 Tax=Marivita sp. GX14005 TaxID=2942276 RepID=UPI00201860CE|nr:cytochrome P450 [Marivita sp. GX14005]MCL3882465.1 cytochrome P450 [Marivita sp. GX14005]
MTALPNDTLPDATAALLADPYRYILTRTRALGTKGFCSRFIAQKAVFLTGAEAAELIYDQSKFTREGAVPAIARDVLFGKGGVQGLDGARHHRRKAMFLKIMGPDADLDAVADLFEEECRNAARKWGDDVDLFDEAKLILTRVAFRWADVPFHEADLKAYADDLSDLFLHAGPHPIGQIEGRKSRHSLERDMQKMIERHRSGDLDAKPSGALAIIAGWRDGSDDLLPGEIAAVELLNVLRPTVAIAVYLTFVAHAISRHPASARRLPDDAEWRHAFVQEIRRTYPFFPATAAIARNDIDWHGTTIEAGTRVVLDIYGTNREAEVWDDPDRFEPERFLSGEPGRYSLIPQGGGAHAKTHRCPGEWLTILLMERFAAFLTRDLGWRLSDPNSALDYSALPARPEKPLRLTDLVHRF